MNMKKAVFVMGIVVLLCGLVCITLSSCFGSSGSGTGTTPNRAVTTAVAPEPSSSFQYDLNEEGNGVVIKKYIGSNPKLVIPGKIEGYPVVQVGISSEFWGSGPIIPKNLLVSLVIPEGVSFIGGSAFEYQGNLTSVTLPSTLKVIDSYAFEASGLRTVRIPDSVERIGKSAFKDSVNLTNVNIPAGIKRIEPGAFTDCKALSNVTIPASIKSIEWWSTGYYSFYGCALTLATRQRLTELGYPSHGF